MNVFLVRHGEAEPATFTVKDFDRQLTPEGREILIKAAQGWKKLIGSLDLIVSSPLIRAMQTATIIKESFNVKNDILTDKKILSGDPSSIIEIANGLHVNNVLFCGHEPSFSQYTADLIGAPGANINFKKAMIAKVSFTGKARLGAGELEFLVPAKAYK